MTDPRINPNYRGMKCPGCGERLPFLLTDLCSYCTHERDCNEIERLRAALESAIERLGGPEVWGALNQGQMQCYQCNNAYIGVEDVIAELREALKDERE